MFGQNDASSYISDNTGAISTSFDFDAILLVSDLYRQAQKSHLRQAIRTMRNRPTELPSAEVLSEDNINNDRLHRNMIQYSSGTIAEESSCLDDKDVGPGNSARLEQVIPTSSQGTDVEADVPVVTTPLTEQVIPTSSQETDVEADILVITTPPAEQNIDGEEQRLVNTLSALQPKILHPRYWWKLKKRNREKVLILGTSESGRSTMMKALTSVAGGKYTKKERLSFRNIIWTSVVTNAKTVLKAMEELKLPLEHEGYKRHVQKLFNFQEKVDDELLPETIRSIQALWKDRGFEACYKRRNEYQLEENFAYYVNSVTRLGADGYVPTDEDILRLRIVSCGINTVCLSYKDLEYEVLDVGVERKHWVRTFPGVSTIVFMVDPTAYSKRILKDKSKTLIQESLEAFDYIVNSGWFLEAEFIIIFSKMDKLERWLYEKEVKDFWHDFPDLPGDTGIVEHYMQFLQAEFLKCCQCKEHRSRIRIIRGNLVDTRQSSAREVFETLDHLRIQRYIR